MKNRFEAKQPHAGMRLIGFLPLLLSIVILGSFLYSLNSVSETTSAKQLESLENAVSRSIAQCYAVEGMYPPDLDYLKEHYGLVYDEEVYLIDYQPIGSNITPEVTILPLSGSTPGNEE
ncbi:MAG: hypothetical protein IJ379_09035 [Lachnospiraceae bacterium]|nr:hypothetical protein [Lachnospiraceae bacterium]